MQKMNKPCPFCGSEPEKLILPSNHIKIVCSSCDASRNNLFAMSMEVEAWENWNQRFNVFQQKLDFQPLPPGWPPTHLRPGRD